MSTDLEIIRQLEQEIGVKLEELKEGNWGDSVGYQLDDQQRVVVLSLYEQKLKKLPRSVSKLTALTNLNLRFNQFTVLPPEISHLTALMRLDLIHNRLTTLPPEIGHLTAITTLFLSDNQLTALPPEISHLTALASLRLGRNQLTTLPPEIPQLTALTYLHIDSNRLTTLPPEINQLTALTTLDLGHNRLTVLPPEITHLVALTTLLLYSNQLTTLPPEIGRLAALTSLLLDSNQLTTLPPEIGQLTALTILHLGNNRLTTLPPEIERLTALTDLELERNRLTSLPKGILHLKNLKKLNLEDNRLNQPPPEIIAQGTESIFEYLRQLFEEEIEHNEVKLILVGQGDVGKTCLANRLMFGTFQQEKSTEGIDIRKWSLTAPTEKKEEITLNVWDFGGQEIYHATHQFFLTKRSVYLLVWNARKAKDYEHIHKWLHTIEAFGEESPIILVLTKLNERDDDLNMKDLREQFPQIVGLYKVDSKDGRGIPELQDIITRTVWNLPHLPTQWIKAWFNVRERLEVTEQKGVLAAIQKIFRRKNPHQTPEQIQRNWITCDEFYRICHVEGLNEKQIRILDEYLHDLGVIIHFRKHLDLKNMVILNPEWVTNAVYKILDTPSVRERAGILLPDELEQIWDTALYPRDTHPKLLQLMNTFELAYELPDKHRYLVAELLPSTEPEFPPELAFRFMELQELHAHREELTRSLKGTHPGEEENAVHRKISILEEELRRREAQKAARNLHFYYRYSFLPAGVMTRFIVRIHDDLESQADGCHLCWREGCVLKYDDTRALVKVRPIEKLVEIHISGNHQRELLAIIRREFDHINNTIKKVKISQEIPCQCSADCSHRFDYNQLLKAEQLGKQAVDCPVTWKVVPVTSLLDGYENKHKRTQQVLEREGQSSRYEVEPQRSRDVHVYVQPQQHVQQITTQTSTQSVQLEVNVSIDLPTLQSEFEDLKDLLLDTTQEPKIEKKLQEIGDSLDSVSPGNTQAELKTPLNKLGRFLKKLGDEKSDYHKLLKGTKRGVELAQKLAKTYNTFAQWLALPQIPDVFLGK